MLIPDYIKMSEIQEKELKGIRVSELPDLFKVEASCFITECF